MASDFGEKRARWSNFGSWCDLCAPGDGITSLWRAGGTSILTGTSQSAPHVTAIAALARTLNPQLDRIDTELVIEYAAKDVGTPGRDSTYEWGIADLHRALDMAGSLTLSATTTTVGGSVDLYVHRPDSPFDFFVLVPSISERAPGIPLGAVFPGDPRYVPVNQDIVTDLSFLIPNLGVWVGFAGKLDIGGRATATFNVPGGKLFAHKTCYFSGILLPVNNPNSVKWVLNSVALDVQ
jgi:subtilisin family serine protease